MNYLYSMCYYAGKMPIEMEYIWTYPRLMSTHTEQDFRVTGELSVWRNMVWGRKIMHVFGMFDGWGYRHNYMDEEYSCELSYTLGPTGILVREAGTAIPTAKARCREFWPILRDSEVVTPPIALLVPATSMINGYPYHGPFDAYSTINAELIRWERFLTPRDYDCRFVPEEVIVSGEQNLADFSVVIIPHSPYFPDGLADELIEFVNQGGVLICSGPAGLYDAYGFDKPKLFDALLGPGAGFEYAGDDSVWSYAAQMPQGARAAVSTQQGDALVLSNISGAGSIYVSTQPFLGSSYEPRLQPFVEELIQGAIAWPTAGSRDHSFEMVTRNTTDGQRYLFIVNPHLQDEQVDYVTVDGEYSEVRDLGIGEHCRVPLAPRTQMAVNSRADCTSRHTDGSTFISVQSLPGRTTFQMRLAPGEGTVLELVP